MKKHKQKPVEPPSQNEQVETIGNNQPIASNGSVEHDGNSIHTYQTQNVSKELNKIKSRVNQVRMLVNIQICVTHQIHFMRTCTVHYVNYEHKDQADEVYMTLS